MPEVSVWPIRTDHPLLVGVEKACQKIPSFTFGQFFSGLAGEPPSRIGLGLVDVSLDLIEQARHEIDGLVNRGVSLTQKGHIHIVFRAVKTDPWKNKLARVGVEIGRLMLMPEQAEIYLRF